MHPSMAEPSARCAVVTGGNKGLGFEICKQLAEKGVTVVLTARDEKRGLEALEKLQQSGLSDHVLFHQLNVVDSASISALAEFVKSQFGKLDILVNNAGIPGGIVHYDKLRTKAAEQISERNDTWDEIMTQTHEAAVEGVQTNYYGAKWVAEGLIPLLQLSDSPRIVNISTANGKLKNIPNEWAKKTLDDAENLGEESVDQVLNEFLQDIKDGNLHAKGWPAFLAAYTVSKAAMNAHTRILAKKHPGFKVNAFCPGFIKTDMNENTGTVPASESAEKAVRLALLPDDGPSGLFFVGTEVSSFVD